MRVYILENANIRNFGDQNPCKSSGLSAISITSAVSDDTLPSCLKMADFLQLNVKEDPRDQTDYRPINILALFFKRKFNNYPKGIKFIF